MVTEMLRMLNSGHFDQAFITSLRPVEYPQVKADSYKEKTQQDVKQVVYKDARGRIIDYDPDLIWE
nr:MAG TPA: hypothetical protein [Caudoviricetes sp.]